MNALCLLSGAALCAGFCGTVSAASILVAPTATPVTLTGVTGEFLPAGTRVRLGFFVNSPDFSRLDCTEVPDAVASGFIPLGEAVSPSGLGTPGDHTLAISGTTHTVTGAVANVVYGNGAPNTLTPGSLSRGTRLFLLVEPLSGGEPGIYSADSWLVPTLNDNNLVLRLLDVDTPAEVFRGRLEQGNLVAGSLCPEPAVALLALYPLLFLIARRRSP